ncbi:MAG: hypothetical protein GKS03_17085 [Alphaproteobacteria bacterium]|nr:hypothetical protein [Alphaproteobacteria bacterium]
MIPETSQIRLLSLSCVMAFAITTTGTAIAQDTQRSRQVGASAQSSDMWTQAMSGLGLFTPHRDDCNATTEVFVKVYAENSIDFGFCMDKDERSAGIVEWEDARQECLDDGKRLPEPAEYKFACQIGTGLSNTTDDWEWSSNFVAQWRNSFGSKTPGISTVASGNGSCLHATQGWAGLANGTQDSFGFRCVR